MDIVEQDLLKSYYFHYYGLMDILFDVIEKYNIDFMDIIASSKKSIVVKPRQSGGTLTLLTYALYEMLNNPNKTIVFVTPRLYLSINSISVIYSLIKKLPSNIKPLISQSTKDSITFSNGSRILARSTSTSLRGLSSNILILDEFDYIDNQRSFYNNIIPSLSCDSKIIMCSTPNKSGSMFYDIWCGAHYGIDIDTGIVQTDIVNDFVPYRYTIDDISWQNPINQSNMFPDDVILNEYMGYFKYN